jgi:6-phosphogluconolactonase
MSSVSSNRIWVGSYTSDSGGNGEGITRLTARADGTLESHGIAVAADSPSYLTRAGDVLYAVGEGAPSISAFRVAGDELRLLGTQGSAGTMPCSVSVIGEGSLLVTACYGDGVVDVHPLEPDGSIGRTSQSLRGKGSGSHADQHGPHAHDVLQLDASTVLTTDLGSDDIYVHTLETDALARTRAISLPTGTGPRDLFLHPSGRVWVLGELSNEIIVLEPSDGGLVLVGSTPLPGAETGDHSAAIAMSVDGRFAYSGLRGSDRIAVLSVSPDGRYLEPIGYVECGGAWPRHVIVDGPFLRVANQLSNTVVSFEIGADGIPTPIDTVSVASPAYLLVG